MKKTLTAIFLLLIISCGTNKNIAKNALYEILTQQKDGGANIEFYEILTEANEIKMLLNDNNLNNKIKEKDIETCNFIILNSGFKNQGNNKIEIESVIETTDKIIIKIKKPSNVTKPDFELATVNPYMILKIFSKKEIIFE